MPVAASVHHQFQIDLQSGQTADALLDLREAGFGDHVGGRARLAGIILQGEQGADRLDFKSQLPRMADEHQTAQIGVPIVTAIALTAERGWQ